MSNAIIDHLLIEIRGEIGFLYHLSETLANLDLIMSLAEVSANHEFVRPSFGDNLEIRQGRHPILDQMPIEVVANNVFANTDKKLHVITGPNMSGKSTYLRQIVLLQIMAQVSNAVFYWNFGGLRTYTFKSVLSFFGFGVWFLAGNQLYEL